MNAKAMMVLVIITILVVGYYVLTLHQDNPNEYTSTPTLEKNKNIPKVEHTSTNTPPQQENTSTSNNTSPEQTTTNTTNTSTTTPTNTITTTPSKEEIHFYIFGLYTCPHCQHLKTKIIKYYGPDHLTFYSLGTEEGFKKYGGAFEILTHYTYSSGVPQVGIFENGHLKVVILGDFGNDDFTQRVEYYLTTVNNIIQTYNQPHILIHSREGAYYVNDTQQIQTLTDVFLHPEKFSNNS